MKRLCVHARSLTVLGMMVLLISALLWPGCTASRKPRPEFPPDGNIKTVLVVPFTDQTALHKENQTYRCGLCGVMFTTGRVEAGADDFVTDKAVAILSERKTMAIIPNDRVDAVRRQVLGEHETPPNEMALLVEIGKKLGADAVLAGSVYRYQQREGSDFAAESPASVGLDLDLIQVETGRLIWHAKFDETQEYLTNNFMKIFTFFKRGGKWVTAEKLAASGLEELLGESSIP